MYYLTKLSNCIVANTFDDETSLSASQEMEKNKYDEMYKAVQERTDEIYPSS